MGCCKTASHTIFKCNIFTTLIPFFHLPPLKYFLGQNTCRFSVFVQIAKCIYCPKCIFPAKCIWWNDSVGPLCSLPLFLHCQSCPNKKSRSSTLSPDLSQMKFFTVLIYCSVKGGNSTIYISCHPLHHKVRRLTVAKHTNSGSFTLMGNCFNTSQLNNPFYMDVALNAKN